MCMHASKSTWQQGPQKRPHKKFNHMQLDQKEPQILSGKKKAQGARKKGVLKETWGFNKD